MDAKACSWQSAYEQGSECYIVEDIAVPFETFYKELQKNNVKNKNKNWI